MAANIIQLMFPLDKLSILMREIIKIKLSQIYLETARSYLYSSIRSRPIEELINDNEFQHDKSTFILGLASISTLYSYLAIESFINYNLYELWEHSRTAKESIDRINQENPSMNAIPIYQDFYNKYGKFDDFSEIRKTDLRELKERIKVLCKEFEYPQIHEVNPELWRDFTGLLESTRHFLVHPNPEEKEFHKFSQSLIQDVNLFIKYPTIAANIIAHFYHSAKAELPEYLNKNEIFIIKEIIVLK